LSNPLVSVIVAVFNGERFLGAALDSALDQTYSPVEVIVVDDGSDDASAEVARRRGVRVLRRGHRGVSAARNAGIAVARGAFLAFLDSDDLCTPDRLAIQVEHLHRNPHLGFVLARAHIFLEPGTPRPGWFKDEWIAGESERGVLGTLLARAELFRRLGGFDTSYDLCEDLEWLARAKVAGVSHEVLSDAVLHYRFHGANATFHRRVDLQAAMMRTLRLSAARYAAAATRARSL
jgi:glycosyltransferase involved in cell wall biosynthesis